MFLFIVYHLFGICMCCFRNHLNQSINQSIHINNIFNLCVQILGFVMCLRYFCLLDIVSFIFTKNFFFWRSFFFRFFWNSFVFFETHSNRKCHTLNATKIIQFNILMQNFSSPNIWLCSECVCRKKNRRYCTKVALYRNRYINRWATKKVMVHQHMTAIIFINRSIWKRAIYMKSLSVIMIHIAYSRGTLMCCAAIWSSLFIVHQNSYQLFQVMNVEMIFGIICWICFNTFSFESNVCHVYDFTKFIDFLITSNSIDQLTSILGSDEFELDKNYYRVEPTLDCHQKESVQVSFSNYFQ